MIPLSHTAATYVIAKQPVDVPAGDAEIIFTVDGTQYARPVTIPGGMHRDRSEIAISSRDANAPF